MPPAHKHNIFESHTEKGPGPVMTDAVYRTFFEESRDMICMTSHDDRLLDVNCAGVTLLGYNSKQQILDNLRLDSLFHSEKNLQKWKDLINTQWFVKEFEATLVKKNGGLIAALLTSCTIQLPAQKNPVHATLVRDVTESMRNKMQVHKMNVELIDSLYNLRKTQPKLVQQEKLASIGQLAAGIAHELNNPIGFISSNFTSLRAYIGIIKNYIHIFEGLISRMNTSGGGKKAELIQELNTFRDEKKLDYIFKDIDDLANESMEGIQRITEIVRSLRNFSRIDNESGIEQYDFNDALESTLTVAKNEIKYVADVKKELAEIPLVECIGGEINQVLLNIIVNSAQAIKSQNQKEKGLITIRTYRKDDYAVCEISDNGPGIPKNIIGKIFDPFFTTKEAGKGTGLGLNISYDIVVHKHKGDLFVESTKGKGTTFTIKLPLKSRIQKEFS
jgi:two-component system NtrC family sensor kinase